LEDLPDGIVVLDDQWRCTYINPVAARLFGTDQEFSVGRLLWDILPGYGWTQMREQLADTVASRKVTRDDVLDPGSSRWYEVTCCPSADGATLVVRDVTRQKTGEEVLLDGRRTLELALEASKAGVWRIELNPN
jgi:PAS domain S-box-containing protein